MLWCADTTLARQFTLPTVRSSKAVPISHTRRVELLGHILTDTSAPRRSRVAAGLVLFYAQSASRTLDDIVHHEDQVLLRLGNPATPVPLPLATLLLDYAADRANMRTGTNPGSRWLVPGRRANQPLRPEHLAKLVDQLGVPAVAGRGAAIRQHVLDMAAPVVADALGYHHVTTIRLATHAGATWSRYAPGDHPQPITPRTRDS